MRWLTNLLTSLITRPLRWAAGAAAGLLLLVVVVVGAVGWVGSERLIHPAPEDAVPAAADFDLPLEEIVLLSRDGTRLAGWFIPPPVGSPREAPTLLLLHGYGDQKELMLPHADYLHGAGYNVLLLDFRASGASDGDAVTVGFLEQQDALGAIDYLEARGDIDMARIGLQGVSMGAAVAIMAAADDERVSGVVAEAPFKDLPSVVSTAFEHFIGLPAFPFAPVTIWITERRLGMSASQVSPLRAVPGLAGRPLLLIVDELDREIPPEHVDAIFAAAGEPKERWVAPGAGHAAGHDVAPQRYQARVLEFWARVFR